MSSARDKNSSYPQVTFETGRERPHCTLGKSIKSIVRGRFNNFVGGHYSSKNLSSALITTSNDKRENVYLSVWSPKAGEKPSFEEAKGQKYVPAKKGDRFGPSWSNHWFKITLDVPPEWSKYERVQFEFDPGCEALIYTPEGLPLHAIVGGHDSLRRVEHVLNKKARNSSYHIFIEVSCNGMFGVPQGGAEIEPPDPNRYFTLEKADLVVPNMEAWRLMDDFEMLKQMADFEDTQSPISERALKAANNIMSTWNALDPEGSIKACRKIAEGLFGKDWEKDGDGVWRKGNDDDAKIWALGHCHIDCAWLWPFSVTQQKVARSWSTQVDLMERYPEHYFSATSAQQYKWLEELYPLAFDRVKAKIDEGQFGYVGATWVEMDTNLPSGESLCRQFLYGQAYFKSRFGKISETFVLPDTFGYSAQLPQIARLGGTNAFFTQKMSWSNINTFPHTTFNWVGIDGSQIFTHMTPVDTYNAQGNYAEVQKGATAGKNLEATADALYLFGNGDGGGGPVPPMLERLRRLRALGNENRDVPLIKIGNHMDAFFDHLKKKTDNGRTLPNWRGELYLELHRGTYTSHANIKADNRKIEYLLRDVEYASTMASLSAADKGFVYPKKSLDWCWEHLLLCQFHDLAPGSAIALAYREAEAWYAEIFERVEVMLEAAFKALFVGSLPLSKASSVKAPEGKIFAVNTMRVPRREVVLVPLGPAKSSSAVAIKSSMAQLSSNGIEGFMLVDATSNGVGEAKGIFADLQAPTAACVGKDEYIIKSSTMQLTLKDGRISSLVDLQLGRELIAEGKTGGFVIFEDMPNYWDAWDTEIYHIETPTHLKFSHVSVKEVGPLRASLAVKLVVGKSTLNCTISLDAVGGSVKEGSRSLIRFDTEVEWRERHRFLKFEIPLDIHAMNATYETQFGTVSRPTHRNTSWDQAKFEVCAHKFADLSEYGYGVAMVNDSKYGHAVNGEVMTLSLLRSPTAPDAEQDQGEQRFAFALYPHAGAFLESDVPQVAAAFNAAMHLRFMPDAISFAKLNALSTFNTSFVVEGAKNVVAETIKLSEEDASSTSSHAAGKEIIVRLYEAFGGHAKATLKISGIPIKSAVLTNILEQETGEAALVCVSSLVKGSDVTTVELDLRGYEIKTVKLRVGESAVSKIRGAMRESDEWVRIEKR